MMVDPMAVMKDKTLVDKMVEKKVVMSEWMKVDWMAVKMVDQMVETMVDG